MIFVFQVRFGKYIFLAFFAGFNPGLTLYSCSYSSQALDRYKLKAECLFLICLGLLFALNCSFWYVLTFLISNLLRLQDAWKAYVRRTETKEERKRTTKWYPSNSLKLVEEVIPQILFLDINRLLFLQMSYEWMHISKTWFSRFFLCSGMKLEFLMLTGIIK